MSRSSFLYMQLLFISWTLLTRMRCIGLIQPSCEASRGKMPNNQLFNFIHLDILLEMKDVECYSWFQLVTALFDAINSAPLDNKFALPIPKTLKKNLLNFPSETYLTFWVLRIILHGLDGFGFKSVFSKFTFWIFETVFSLRSSTKLGKSNLLSRIALFSVWTYGKSNNSLKK